MKSETIQAWEEKNVGKIETKGGVANVLLYYLWHIKTQTKYK
jgi:hypothetical protein